MEDATGRLRDLPSVDEVLSRPAVRALAEQVGRAAVKAAARQAIAAARARILSGGGNGALVADADVVQRAEAAGAALLALAALGSGAAAVVSRGELVELGGGFRVPEILAQSGCRLVEVGTTNRTRLSDYAAALDGLPRALLLRVHRSNFALVGF